MNDRSSNYDVVVIGGGPAGLAAAVALAETGANTALVARRVPYADNRTTALLGDSVDLLERLEVWPRCRDQAAALRVMRLVDDTGRLIRAPEVRFCCDEIGLDVFGYNIENRALIGIDLPVEPSDIEAVGIEDAAPRVVRRSRLRLDRLERDTTTRSTEVVVHYRYGDRTADSLSDTGGATLAAEVGAASCAQDACASPGR